MDVSKKKICLAVESEQIQPVRATPLCRPEARTLLGYTRRILHVKEERRLGVFSFSNGGDANWLFLISIDDGTAERYDVPNDEQASHGAALGSDGNIYELTFGERLHKFDVGRRRWETLCRPLPAGERPWDAIGAPNGCVYFGTYPSACFGEYCIETGEVFLREQVELRQSSAHPGARGGFRLGSADEEECRVSPGAARRSVTVAGIRKRRLID